jgi:hypothetical protein
MPQILVGSCLSFGFGHPAIIAHHAVVLLALDAHPFVVGVTFTGRTSLLVGYRRRKSLLVRDGPGGRRADPEATRGHQVGGSVDIASQAGPRTRQLDRTRTTMSR